MKTAIVIGATGLIGNHLVHKLLKDDNYKLVRVFSRCTLEIENPKLEENIVNFANQDTWKDLVKGDVLFSCMGTTIKKAGSREEQFKVDFTYQYSFAKKASEKGIEKYLLVSSSGADSGSSNFYLRTKGNLEDRVERLNFKNIIIFQPSLLLGNRNEKRFGETIGAIAAKVLLPILPFLEKYRPIEGEVVAEAMIRAAERSSDEHVKKYSLDEIFKLANSKN